MVTMSEVGARIRSRLPAGMTQGQLAQQVEMTPDALSRALNGQRGLSPIEIASIAKVLGSDTHWLITGAPDPLGITIAARHAWDADRRVRNNPGAAEDKKLLQQVDGLYRAAFPHGPSPSLTLPYEPSELRVILGENFVRDFADVVQKELNVDVIRIPGLKTDYSLRIGQRGVIVLATQAKWFRSNWSLAHELGHLAMHHRSTADHSDLTQADERAADAFAAQLLLPEHVIDEVMSAQTESTVAHHVWDLGISVQALQIRLSNAQLTPSRVVAEALRSTTPHLLRSHIGADQVTEREQAAAARRFPTALLSTLQAQTEVGAASPVHLAWALTVPVDEIDFPDFEEDSSDFAAALADRPSVGHRRSLLARSDSNL